MNKAEREDFERQLDQTERRITAMNRLAAAFERVADAQEAGVVYQTGRGDAITAYVASKGDTKQ